MAPFSTRREGIDDDEVYSNLKNVYNKGNGQVK